MKICYLGFALKSLFAGVGDRRQETGDRRQETGDRRQPNPRPSPSQEGKTGEKGRERGGRSNSCPFIFLPNSCLKYAPF
ncbi:MAG: hypothetical protein F6K08_12755 [Okeania sp. SIO1H6]|nr:hypothetical protein [Okeania sp. SIO1H6]